MQIDSGPRNQIVAYPSQVINKSLQKQLVLLKAILENHELEERTTDFSIDQVREAFKIKNG